MNWPAPIHNKTARSAIGAVLAIACGLILWKSSWAVPLSNYSYDALWLFGSRTPTNNVTFIMMDDESYQSFHQKRGEAWDRHLHARLLNKLADDNCSMVVLDNYLGQPRDSRTDQELVRAIQRHHEIAMRAAYKRMTVDESSANHPDMPAKLFLTAARKNWGVSRLVPDSDGVVRRDWPFPSPGKYPSLAETAARTAGAVLDGKPHERWIRYYGSQPEWPHISYALALKQPANFFHGQMVFLGIKPRAAAPENSPHKFVTPYSHWTHKSAVATDLLITEFLNLLNDESLSRSATIEFLGLLLAGAAIGAMLPQVRRAFVVPVVALFCVVVAALSVALTATTNYWFPCLLIVIGQLPVALVWTAVTSPVSRFEQSRGTECAPKIPGYSLVEPAFGHGAYGKVWLTRNKRGEWRAIKVVSLDNFDNDNGPYDREYEGVSRYREICDKHPGLLRVEFVSEKLPTHFYYVMELGDALESGWERNPAKYKPRALNFVRSLSPQKRLPVQECINIGIELCDTLAFLHCAGFTHRDIKPQNILFVHGRPKLADLGLITNIRTFDSERTAVGTPGYMPPAPEMPGTIAADIYALGMVLYVLSTGLSPASFPELPETLLGDKDPTPFFGLNTVVLKACQPHPKDRYGSAREMYAALEQLKSKTSSTAQPSADAGLQRQDIG